MPCTHIALLYARIDRLSIRWCLFLIWMTEQSMERTLNEPQTNLDENILL